MRLWVLLCFSAAVTGCATEPPLEQRLLPFVGRSEGDLVAALGVPERTYEVESRKFLTFEDQRSYITAGHPFLYSGIGGYGYGYGRRGYGYGRRGYGPFFAPPGYIVRSCEITFALRESRVESFSFRGDGCR